MVGPGVHLVVLVRRSLPKKSRDAAKTPGDFSVISGFWRQIHHSDQGRPADSRTQRSQEIGSAKPHQWLHLTLSDRFLQQIGGSIHFGIDHVVDEPAAWRPELRQQRVGVIVFAPSSQESGQQTRVPGVNVMAVG